MKTLLAFCFLLSAMGLNAQQLYLEGFGALGRTDYSIEAFSQSASYGIYGARMAVGADHIQVGGEYHANLSHPEFQDIIASTAFEEIYYGGFLRAKLSRYPATRFGLVLRAGAGLYNTTAVWKSGSLSQKEEYDPILGVNGGVGISIPTFNKVMLELGYTYNYVQRPELTSGGIPLISEHNGSYHLFSAGLSLNFVFGKRAKQYQHMQENRKWKNGWRG